MENKQQIDDLQRCLTSGWFRTPGRAAKIRSTQAWLQKNQAMVTSFNDDLSQSMFDLHDQKLRRKILNSLSFYELNDRYSKIAEAQSKTFNWIYETGAHQDVQWSNFAQWLAEYGSRCNRLYWVSGKPGSGKSTLMRFMCDDMRTSGLLKKWSKGVRVLSSSCFFWNAGTTLQKSLQGLLQTLLTSSFLSICNSQHPCAETAGVFWN